MKKLQGLVVALCLIPLCLWADTVTIPVKDGDPGLSPVKTAGKAHPKKRRSKKHHKKSVVVEKGSGMAQEEVTDQREVSQQPNSAQKHPK